MNPEGPFSKFLCRDVFVLFLVFSDLRVHGVWAAFIEGQEVDHIRREGPHLWRVNECRPPHLLIRSTLTGNK